MAILFFELPSSDPPGGTRHLPVSSKVLSLISSVLSMYNTTFNWEPRISRSDHLLQLGIYTWSSCHLLAGGRTLELFPCHRMVTYQPIARATQVLGPRFERSICYHLRVSTPATRRLQAVEVKKHYSGELNKLFSSRLISSCTGGF